ncbi:hypothetical protein OF83DRAFT_173976 [Amylostereum chailletii]|nr:hypothetical protein OF83DRAFT_173976 [Amylostereum chailletii]
MFVSVLVSVLSLVCMTSAKDIWIQVGGNTTQNASLVFQPGSVAAQVGDTVFFNFTQGNHSAIQSTFDAPCVPIHIHNTSLNGFDDGLHLAGNGSNVTIEAVPILQQSANTTFWFYDVNTCGQGGVGVINSNESSTQTLEGFIRNAIRLNGTSSSSSSSSSAASRTSTATSTSASATGTSSSGDRAVKIGALSAVPAFLALLL